MTETITIRPAATPRPSLGGGPAPAYRRGPTKSPERRPGELVLPHHGQAVDKRQAGAIQAITERATEPTEPSSPNAPHPADRALRSRTGPANRPAGAARLRFVDGCRFGRWVVMTGMSHSLHRTR